jgi:metallophosphoesterase (TIGR00282 family)
MLKLLAIGDVTTPRAAQALASSLWSIRKAHDVDFVSVNAENAGFIMGPTPDVARTLLNAGADVLTGGNHILQNVLLHPMLENDSRILRPVNFPAAAPGVGYTLADARGYRVLVVNAMGRVHMEPPVDSPFDAIERILAREEGNYDLAVLDIHAEATGEKVALAHRFDGRFAAIFGTHTHVPTADCQVLPRGTGYVTDLGMCGAEGGILGIDEASVMKRYLTGISSRFSPADGALYADGVLFTVEETGRCESVERLRFSLS